MIKLVLIVILTVVVVVSIVLESLEPHAGFVVVRIDLLHFLAGCHTSQLKRVPSFISYYVFYCVVVYWGPFLCIVSFR